MKTVFANMKAPLGVAIVVIVCFGSAVYSAYTDNRFYEVVQAINRSDLNTVERIVRGGNFSDINRLTNKQDTLLNLAVEKGNIDMVYLLIQSGADINQGGVKIKGVAQTPLDTAAKNNRPEIAEMLIGHNARLPFHDNNFYVRSPLHWAVYAGFESFAKLLIQRRNANVNEAIAGNSTLLHLAVQQYKTTYKRDKAFYDIAKLLLQEGANVNAQDGQGQTPIYYAIDSNKYKLRNLLFDHKANLGLLNKNGKSVLHVAAEEGEDTTITKLLDHGANINQTTPQNQTALHLVATSKSKSKSAARCLVRNHINFLARDAWNKTAADYVQNTTKTAELLDILNGNNALTICANIIMVLFLLIGTMFCDRLQQQV